MEINILVNCWKAILITPLACINYGLLELVVNVS